MITLSVDDGLSTAYDEVVITVQATVTGLRELLDDFVASGDVDTDKAAKLDGYLSKSEAHVEDGKHDKAIQDLDSFKHEVDKLRDAGVIPAHVAEILQGSATAVVGTLKGTES